MSTTKTEYMTLADAFDHFNKRLFGGKLPQPLITLQRKSRSRGYFSASRFTSRTGKTTTHEIALNPDTFHGRSDAEIFSTLVHEMVHLWQDDNGSAPATPYHNKEWANKMEEVGLMPSSTGEEGGKRTGQQMSHYIIEGGAFDDATKSLKGTRLQWESSKFSKKASKKKAASKTKFTCVECDANVWGKPDSNILCGDCESNPPMVNLDA